jgi:hypothetical protein
MTRDTIIQITSDAALGAGLDPASVKVRAFRNNVAASVLLEFEWQRDVRAALVDVESVARSILADASDGKVVGKDLFAQLALALRRVDELRKLEERDQCTADGAYTP